MLKKGCICIKCIKLILIGDVKICISVHFTQYKTTLNEWEPFDVLLGH